MLTGKSFFCSANSKMQATLLRPRPAPKTETVNPGPKSRMEMNSKPVAGCLGIQALWSSKQACIDRGFAESHCSYIEGHLGIGAVHGSQEIFGRNIRQD